MSKYAIIKIGPFQYTVEEGMEYEVPNFEAEAGKNMSVTEVLAIGDGENVTFGTPVIKGASVELNVLEQAKGEKINTRVYKAKSRYRKAHGHRKRVTKFKVEKIVAK
jgi:large subunit ribosomal protein L21